MTFLISHSTNLEGEMNPKHPLYPVLLIAALILAACGPRAAPEPTATPTPLRGTDTSTPLAPTETRAPTATTEQPTPTPSKTEESAVSEGEVPMGFTKEGAPYRGNPNAPVTLVEHSEFQ